MRLSAVATAADSGERGCQPHRRSAFSWDTSGMYPSSARMTRVLGSNRENIRRNQLGSSRVPTFRPASGWAVRMA